MIDNNKINSAAQGYSDAIYGTLYTNLFIVEAFREGANWAINEFLKSLWHPNTEESDKSESDIITLSFGDDAYLHFKESVLWNNESWRHSISRCQITKWAYLSNILPKEGDNYD